MLRSAAPRAIVVTWALTLAWLVSVGPAGPPAPDSTPPTAARPPLPQSPADVPVYREEAREALLRIMGPLPDPGRAVPLDVRIVRAETLATFTREFITFTPEPGDRATACLLLPRRLHGRAPAALCLHEAMPWGLAGVVDTSRSGGMPYGRELAERGYVVLATNYPNYGDYRCDPYSLGYQSATMKGIWNRMRAVDLLLSLPQVDPGRIACVGHSLGGHNALFSADFDPRIRAVVSSCALTSLSRYNHGDLAGWSTPQYMPRIRTECANDATRMPFGFTEVLALVAPRPVLVVAARRDGIFDIQGVRSCVQRARTVYEAMGAAANLDTLFFDGLHDFPRPVRKDAYAWLDRQLGVRASAVRPATRSGG